MFFDIFRRIGKDLRTYRPVILIFAVYYGVVHWLFGIFCPFARITGFPCAGCGMTRAVGYLMLGKFGQSWEMHPMAVPVLAFGAYCFVQRYVLGSKIKGCKEGILLLCFLLLAVYIYRMYTRFPNSAPYAYTQGNYLETHFPLYGEMMGKLFSAQEF